MSRHNKERRLILPSVERNTNTSKEKNNENCNKKDCMGSAFSERNGDWSVHDKENGNRDCTRYQGSCFRMQKGIVVPEVDYTAIAKRIVSDGGYRGLDGSEFPEALKRDAKILAAEFLKREQKVAGNDDP